MQSIPPRPHLILLSFPPPEADLSMRILDSIPFNTLGRKSSLKYHPTPHQLLIFRLAQTSYQQCILQLSHILNYYYKINTTSCLKKKKTFHTVQKDVK